MSRLQVDELAAEGIHTVLVATPDIQGRLIGRRVPAGRFASILETGVEVCTCAWAWDVEQGFELIGTNSVSVCSLHNGAPDVALIPDLTTLRRAAWLDGIAVCLADPVWPGTGEPLRESPRTMLRAEVARYREQGLRPQAGTELEFYMFRNDPHELRLGGFRDLVPTTLTPSDFLLEPGNRYEPFFRRLRENLDASGIEIEAAQSEWGSGQWEMTFVYGDPLEMADRHALYKMAVRDMAAMAGYSVTFMAKPLGDQPGSSCHVHFSVLDDADRPVFWDEDGEHRMSDRMRSAMAGVIDRTPELMAWYAPTHNSYARTAIGDVFDYGRSWGRENRYVSNRVVGHDSKSTRFEFRIPGADANPYLVLTGLLASARDGMQRGARLGPATVGVPEGVNADSAMPRTIGEAAQAMADSDFVREIVGEESRTLFREPAAHEWRAALSAVTDWDRNRYFDRI